MLGILAAVFSTIAFRISPVKAIEITQNKGINYLILLSSLLLIAGVLILNVFINGFSVS
jgi:hypothetical protein